MIVTVKYFNEITDEDFKNYSKLWDENSHRIIFFQKSLQFKYQNKHICE